MSLTGKPISPRIAIGPALTYRPFSCDRSMKYCEGGDLPALARQYAEAKASALNELDALKGCVGQADADFVSAHQEILLDPVMNQEILDLIQDKQVSPDSAIVEVYQKYQEIFAKCGNKVIQERAADLRDVETRLLRCWHQVPEKNLAFLGKPCIVVADELFPSDTLALDKQNLIGIVTQKGGTTSHTAIIARSLGIPAILGVSGVMCQVQDGDILVLDGGTGDVILNPSPEQIQSYTDKAKQVERDIAVTNQYFEKEAITRDGVKIQLKVNIASAKTEDLQGIPYIDGVGLFRSEFLYLSQDRLPDEEFQFQAYKKVLEAFGDKPVTLRTLDIGGDKQVSYMDLPDEENPFLGNRGIRLCLTYPDIFRTQLRAALRASAYGNLKIMYPMVTSLNELREAKTIVAEVGAELDAAGIPWDKTISLGMMIEVPAIAMIADLVVDEVDFASIGTNDLCQYVCATDRMNASVKAYYQDYHPAVFRLLKSVADVFNQAGKYLGVCGELGGDRLAIPLLVGLGIRSLSMSMASIAQAKQIISHLDTADAAQLAAEALNAKTNLDLKKHLIRFAEAHLLGDQG